MRVSSFNMARFEGSGRIVTYWKLRHDQLDRKIGKALLQIEQLPEPASLRAADGNLGLLFVVHA